MAGTRFLLGPAMKPQGSPIGVSNRWNSALHAHGDAHAAADAERGEALLGVTLLHLEEQRHQHAAARGADRMAERDRPAVDVDLRGVPAEVLVDRTGLRGERLVGLDQIEIADAPAGLL